MAKSRLTAALFAISIASMASFGQGTATPRNIAAEASRNIHRREQWFKQGRVVGRKPAAAARYRALGRKIVLRAARTLQTDLPSATSSILSGEWVQLGPAPVKSDASGTGLQDYGDVAGRATAVTIDPADPTGNTVYLGGAFGGLWKSTNAGPFSTDPSGVGWVPLTDNQATLAVGSIAIQPQLNNPDPSKSVILVGTGETNGSADSYYGLGILRSADAGNTWTLISKDTTQTRSFAGLGFSKIAFNTSTPNLVVAAAAATAEGITEGQESPVLANRGIYYSSDGGVSWNYASVKDGTTPTDPASVSAVVFNAAANQFFAAISLHGIYSSADGITWSRLANQPGSLNSTLCPAKMASPSACPIYRGEFAVVPNRPGPSGKGELYVWFVDANDGDGGIWTSTDGGASWTQIVDAGITNCGDLFGGCGTSQGFYNLALVAVPDGTATDLYAGAVNLYKCTISVISPNCAGTGSGTFINLTHVYGCSSIAKVHPAQHGIASMLINNNNQDLMYFANDGGIYRALDGYSGLTSGDCSGSNAFDSLNETLGSITQLVSFSQSSATSPSPDILLAGAQANGSPATVSAQTSTAWQNINAGDGGYTAISPNSDSLWFVSNPPDSVSGVNIFTCTAGINCRTQDFQNSQIVSGITVGGDAGAFNTPFILDPQNPGEMLVGTCRVWRGPSAGGSFSDLSNNFETGGTGICNGTEVNLVRSIAAGGALDSNGFSNVIYAGTNGTGPLTTGLPTGGHVWVSTNVSGGLPSWNDQTGSINPQNYPVSSIAVDTSDVSGLTAYVGVMGFGPSHIWKTTAGGASWIDFTGNLPPAPVNALVVDAVGGAIYAGTDVGVFASSLSAPTWNEIGPAPGSTKPGFLPNVAVTALHIFNPAGGRRLRASTYGRGLWELSGFNLSRPIPAAVSVHTPGTSVPITMQLTAAAFSGTVNLFCAVAAGAQVFAQCNFVGGGSTLSVNLNPASPVTVNLIVTTMAAAPNGAFSVAIQAGSAGYTTQTQNLPVTILGGFSFTITNTSGAQTITAGQSATYDLNVAPSVGPFQNKVVLGFTGCPPGANCSFNPTSIAAGNGATDVFSISTTSGTPPGSYAITVTGLSGGATASAPLTLMVQSAFSFSLTNSGPATIVAGASAKYDITVTPSAPKFPSPVTLTFATCPIGANCSLDTTTIPKDNGTTHASLTIATTGAAVGNYTITVTGTSDLGEPQPSVKSTTVSFSVTPFKFTMSNSGPATIAVGGSGKYDVTLTPSTGTFPTSVALTFAGCPPAATCSFDTSTVAAGSAATDVFLTVATTSGTPPGPYSIVVNGTSGSQTQATTIAVAVQAFSMSNSGPATILAGSSAKYDITVTPSGATFPNAVVLTFTACTGVVTCSPSTAQVAAGSGTTDVFLIVGTTAGTPPGPYRITVTGTSGALTASTTISFSVTAFNFTMSQPSSQTIAVGTTASAKYDITITPLPVGSTFPNPVTLSFSVCPSVITCSLSAAQVDAGSGPTTVSFTIATTGSSSLSEERRSRIPFYAFWMPLPGLMILFGGIGATRLRRTLLALLAFLVIAWCTGCGGLQGGAAAPAKNPGTPAGVYTVNLIGTSGSLTQTSTFSLTVQ